MFRLGLGFGLALISIHIIHSNKIIINYKKINLFI